MSAGCRGLRLTRSDAARLRLREVPRGWDRCGPPAAGRQRDWHQRCADRDHPILTPSLNGIEFTVSNGNVKYKGISPMRATLVGALLAQVA